MALKSSAAAANNNGRTRVGKYELGRTLGEGNFAKVKFARNVDIDENVAIKILDKEKILKHKMITQGLGIGIIYLMLAGKTEISKLHMAMDETAKFVQELKTELYKRKSSHHLHISGPASKADAKSRKNNSKRT